LDRASIRS